MAKRKIGEILQDYPKTLAYPLKVYQLSQEDPDKFREVVALEKMVRLYQGVILELKKTVKQKPLSVNPEVKVFEGGKLKEIIMTGKSL